jgi:alpha-ribazole phosphatase
MYKGERRLKIILIRHGKTAGNCEKRYIGRTDEVLCPEGYEELRSRKYPKCDLVLCSPMLRCIETARTIYPSVRTRINYYIRECDFGDFEGKNYEELNGNPEYQAWIESGGSMDFPNGEPQKDFKERCNMAFNNIIRTHNENKAIAFIIHGGTIMAILEKYIGGSFYDYHVKNGCGYILSYNGKELKITGEIV